MKTILIKAKEYYETHKEHVVLLVVFLIYFFSRIWLFIQNGERAFGYDTGIYRRHIHVYFEKLGESGVVPFGFTSLTNMLQLLGEKPDHILFFGYLFLSFLIFFAFYAIARRYLGAKPALGAVLLFTVSVVQFEFFWWFYYRNFLALFIILLIFLSLRLKSKMLPLFLFVLGVIHPLSLVPVAITLLVILLIQKEMRKYLIITGISSGLALLALNYREIRLYLPLLTEKRGLVKSTPVLEQYEHTGQFISASFFLKYIWYYLPFALVGLIRQWKKQRELFIFLCINVLLVLIGFLFYRRFFVYIDLVLILFSVDGIVWLWMKLKKRRTFLFVGFVIYFGFLGYVCGMYIAEKEPLISESEFFAIEKLQYYPEDALVMTVNSYYAPWLYGFSGHEVIAPGMFDRNEWDREQWSTFWYARSTEDWEALFEKYVGSHLYIFLGERDQFLAPFFLEYPACMQNDMYMWDCHL
ncbi:MAG: hypothetical protein ABII02_02020 [Candidatus Magasanikbacteria bacterium]